MNKIVIGIIEDDDSQKNKICRTLASHFNNCDLSSKYELGFKEYNLCENSSTIIEQIAVDIEKKTIDFLIVDFKIVTSNSNKNGADIVTELKKIVREFPAIILTEREEECAERMDIDPDKIYSKEKFFKAKDSYSIDAAKKIFKNIMRFSNNRESLKHRIDELKKSNEDNGSFENVDELLLLEKELSYYYPSEETSIEKILDKKSLNEIADLIERANALLGE